MNDPLRESTLNNIGDYQPPRAMAARLAKAPTVAELLGDKYTAEMRQAFPDVPVPYLPLGYLALLQLRMPRSKIGLIQIPDDAMDVERVRVQSALVRSLGFAAFTNRSTGEPWIEGSWFSPGDFVRAPMFGGDRFYVEFTTPDGKKDKVLFVFIKEADAVALVTGDALNTTVS